MSSTFFIKGGIAMILCGALLAVADEIDGNRARALYQKSQAGQQLTPAEQQYLDRAKQEREKAGGGGWAKRSDARAPEGSGESAMDMKRARDLLEKSRRDEKLTPEEQAYLNQATAERRKQGGRAAADLVQQTRPSRAAETLPNHAQGLSGCDCRARNPRPWPAGHPRLQPGLRLPDDGRSEVCSPGHRVGA